MVSSASATRARAWASVQFSSTRMALSATVWPRAACSSPRVPFIWLDRVVSRPAASSTRIAPGSSKPPPGRAGSSACAASVARDSNSGNITNLRLVWTIGRSLAAGSLCAGEQIAAFLGGQGALDLPGQGLDVMLLDFFRHHVEANRVVQPPPGCLGTGVRGVALVTRQQIAALGADQLQLGADGGALRCLGVVEQASVDPQAL